MTPRRMCISNYRNSLLLRAILIIQTAPESCETGLSGAITCITVMTECRVGRGSKGAAAAGGVCDRAGGFNQTFGAVSWSLAKF